MSEARAFTPRVVDPNAPRPYQLAAEFAATVAYLCCSSPRFWNRIGRHIEYDRVPEPRAALLVRACARVSKVTGHGPSGPGAVSQALREFQDAAKAKPADVAAALELLREQAEEANWGEAPNEEECANYVADVVKRFRREDLGIDFQNAVARGESLARLVAKIEEIEAIGAVTPPEIVGLHEDHYDRIVDGLLRCDRLPTGIPDLDAHLGGGLSRGGVSVYGMATGVGKSATMYHQACHAALHGHRVVFAPVEQSAADAFVQIVACFTGIEHERVARGDPEVKPRLARVRALPGFGALVIAKVSIGANVTAYEDATTKALESAGLDGYDVRFGDYWDRLEAKAERGYDKFRMIYDHFARIGEERQTWEITGSQLKDVEARKRKVPLAEDLLDSRWKGQIAVNVITAWKDPETPELRNFHTAKVRFGNPGAQILGVPHDLARSRMALESGLPYEGLAARIDEDDAW